MIAVRPDGLSPRIVRELRRAIEGDVRVDAVTRGIYSTDASIYQVRPLGVVSPRSAADLVTLVQIAVAEGIPLVPRGAGTSQAGQAIGTGLVVDTSRYLHKIVALHPDVGSVTVEPGVVLEQLNRALVPHGRFFPVDVATASRATIGGMTGNNSSGARSVRHGIMADHVRSVEVVLSDGSTHRFGRRRADVRRHGRSEELVRAISDLARREADEIASRVPRVLRHVAGYNLHRVVGEGGGIAPILVGSEGTLGLFARIELSLVELPPHRELVIAHYDDLTQALDAVPEIVALSPSAVELLAGELVERALDDARVGPGLRPFVRGRPGAVLFVEFESARASEPGEKIAELAGITAGPSVAIEDPDEQRAAWAARKTSLNLIMSGSGRRTPVSFIEDGAVPLERLSEYARRVDAILQRHGTGATWYAHASVGCLHLRPALDLGDPADRVRLREIAEEVHALAHELGGSHSGEHGDGLVRSEFIRTLLGDGLANAFEEVKRHFDPDGLFNPGKIVAPPRMDDEELLLAAAPRTPLEVLPALEWREGLAAATERCNNNGACRSASAGVLCPSYRATLDELHSTRARANALRLALTGQLGPDGLDHPEMAEVMDLCVGCKACRTECPMGVDVARMKIELLARRNARDGVPRRDQLFAHVPRRAPLLSRVAGIANRLASWKRMRRLAERRLGVSAARELPRLSPHPFGRRPAERPVPPPGSDGGDPRPAAALWIDTFTRWFEPENARAARRVLEHAGYRTVVVGPGAASGGRPTCCGRTYLSAGMVDEARAEQRRTTAALLPWIRAGVPVIGLEPSCVLTLRDELLAVLPGPESVAVAEGTRLLEEFLVGARGSGSPELRLDGPRGRRFAVHGHCHQKSFGVDGAVAEVLRWLPDATVEQIPSTCCGMAGSFGYEAEHQDVSRAMAELTLLPAIRRLPPEVTVVTTGTSCRHQIRDLSARDSIHVARALAEGIE